MAAFWGVGTQPVTQPAPTGSLDPIEALQAAVAELLGIQALVPEAMAAAVEAVQRVVAIQTSLSGEAFEHAYAAARRIASANADAAVSRARAEADRTGWPPDERSIRASFGEGYMLGLIREAGAPPPWSGMQDSAAALAVADAVETLLGRRPPRVVAFR